MKHRLFLLTLVIALALVSISLVRAGSVGAGSDVAVAPPDAVILSGGHYRLVSTDTQVDVVASGGEYRLLAPAAPTSSENGCCCTFLPCMLRNLSP
jgi:hydroxymethylpyrimidine/phosphomethylpyrimidine kinase